MLLCSILVDFFVQFPEVLLNVILLSLPLNAITFISFPNTLFVVWEPCARVLLSPMVIPIPISFFLSVSVSAVLLLRGFYDRYFVFGVSNQPRQPTLLLRLLLFLNFYTFQNIEQRVIFLNNLLLLYNLRFLSDRLVLNRRRIEHEFLLRW